MRAANSNPTLQIIIFAFDEKDIDDYKKYLEISKGALNSNVKIVTTKDFKEANKDYKDFPDLTDYFTMSSIISLFSYIKSRIPRFNGKQQ